MLNFVEVERMPCAPTDTNIGKALKLSSDNMDEMAAWCNANYHEVDTHIVNGPLYPGDTSERRIVLQLPDHATLYLARVGDWILHSGQSVPYIHKCDVWREVE